VDRFPWDPSNFRFLGTPIDGVQFEDDRVILVEFKTGNSQLSKRQRHIRELVNDGKVDFEVIRVA
jgi:predicted Holliday junction resolvase-like endonuclease